VKKRLAVTGYGGFVAGSVVWQAGNDWHVHAFSRSQAPEQRDGFRCWSFDLCDTQRLRDAFAEAKPHAVIHTAAIADIDYCQSHQEHAEQVNVNATATLARLCGECGAKMILCSTDTVFDGKKGMYGEDDAPTPVNFYGETKVRAEQAVRENLDTCAVARLSLVMGLPVLGAGNSFLAKMMAALRAGDEMRFPENEVRTPVDVITLGRALLELAGNDYAGTLHLAGNTRLNRYDMACQIAERLGYAPDLVAATNSNAMEGRAPRPNDASLDNAKARQVLNTPMQNLLDGLDIVLMSKEKQQHE
jgi:dTDP-4-dehydrorhamnose reductase